MSLEYGRIVACVMFYYFSCEILLKHVEKKLNIRTWLHPGYPTTHYFLSFSVSLSNTSWGDRNIDQYLGLEWSCSSVSYIEFYTLIRGPNSSCHLNDLICSHFGYVEYHFRSLENIGENQSFPAFSGFISQVLQVFVQR